MKPTPAFLLTALLAMATPQAAFSLEDPHQVATGAAATVPATDGEIKKIDKDAGKITIKHGEIKNLDMPPMTMVFQTKDAGLLDKAKVGDKIKFAAEKTKSGYVVTAIEPAK